MLILEMPLASLEAAGASWTGREIAQQPEMLRQTQSELRSDVSAIEAFLSPLLDRQDVRIVLAGAGTSGFIGDSIAPFLAPVINHRIEAIATTDIVFAPHLYLDPHRPMLMVSFGRSGNSPESLAAIRLANKIVKEVWHLIITCNSEGDLARFAHGKPAAKLVLLPEKTHDRSFAMTSSFTCMLHAAIGCLFGIERMDADTGAIAAATEAVLSRYAVQMQLVAKRGYTRVIYLGGGGFKGLAREAALKMTEMTNGKVIALFESTLGVRHGPKVIIDENTLVVLFLSNDAYMRQYDLDLLAELCAQDKYGELLAITARPIENLRSDRQIFVPGLEMAVDQNLLAPFIVVPQMLAMFRSIEMGCTPDDPNPTGIVNRVVRGVPIHEFG